MCDVLSQAVVKVVQSTPSPLLVLAEFWSSVSVFFLEAGRPPHRAGTDEKRNKDIRIERLQGVSG